MESNWKMLDEMPEEGGMAVVTNGFDECEIAEYYNPDPGPFSTCRPSFVIQSDNPKFTEDAIVAWWPVPALPRICSSPELVWHRAPRGQ